MKKFIQLFSILALSLTTLASCEKDSVIEPQIKIPTSSKTQPVLKDYNSDQKIVQTVEAEDNRNAR